MIDHAKKKFLRNSANQTHDHLRPEDRILWETVARTARPIKTQQEIQNQSMHPVFAEQKPTSNSAQTKQSHKAVKSFAPPYHPQLSTPSQPTSSAAPLDRLTHRKLAKGRLDIDARIDLHGLTQREAYALLLHFLQSARQRGLRHVIVITGKGRSNNGQGVLRQSVPHWFTTAPFRLLVSGYEDAARHHGGSGALYVRIKRIRSESTGTS